MRLMLYLHDHKDDTHRDNDLIIDDEATLDQLRERVKSIFHFDYDQQELFFNGVRLCPGTLKESGIEDGGVVVVKHKLLGNWATFCACFESAQKWKQEHRIKAKVKDALDQLKILRFSKFFLAYPRFLSIVDEFDDKFAHYMDADYNSIESAAKDYFSKLLKDNPENPQVRIECRPKEISGAQGGLICDVTKSGTMFGTFHVKTHLGTASHSSKHSSPDLRELFFYRLLELINVGPEVHFIPNVHHSSLGLYIATKDITGFRQAHDVRPMNKGNSLQLDLLTRIFYLTDLHSNNFGLNSDNKLCIVDFQIGHPTKNVNVDSYLQGDEQVYIKVGKASFEHWNLGRMVDEADKRITFQKQLFRDRGVTFQSSKNYGKYLEQIKKNISAFATLFAQE